MTRNALHKPIQKATPYAARTAPPARMAALPDHEDTLTQMQSALNQSKVSHKLQTLQRAINGSAHVAQREVADEGLTQEMSMQRVGEADLEDDDAMSLKKIGSGPVAPVQSKAVEPGGLPTALKSGVEALSGVSMDGVRVHHNSPEPATVQAHAYAQGRDIHLGPGQERHLPHEAWHVAQQAQGRVQPTMQAAGGVAVNDDAGLEREADVMGARAQSTGEQALRNSPAD